MQRRTTNIMASVLLITFSRLVLNVTRRFPYPFLPEIARQLGVSVVSVQGATAMSNGVGLLSPLFSPLSERYGRKPVMVGSMLLMTILGGFGALVPQFAIFTLVIIGFGIGKMIFDPAMQAYLGDRIPYNRRGQALGIVELSWAGALLVAASLAGFLLDQSTLQVLFVVLTILLLVGTIALWLRLPNDAPHKTSTSRTTSLWGNWQAVRRSPTALGALLFSFLLVCANEMFFINYSLWLEISFELVIAALGAATLVIAFAEVLGEFTVIGFADRIGKRRLVLIGTIISGIAYLILPLLNSLPLAIIGLFLMFVAVEIAIVSSIPLFTEILPNARPIMMSTNFSAHSLGRLLGGTVGSFLFALTDSFVVTGVISMIVGLSAAVVLWWLVQETNVVSA